MLEIMDYNGLDRFKYFIITPKKRLDINDVTLFNQFDKSIIESMRCLEFISHFPASYNEYFNEWPHRACNYIKNSDYDIKYINEDLLDKKFIEYIKGNQLGIVFLLKGIKNKTKRLFDNVKIPVILLEEGTDSHFYNLSYESMNDILGLFYNNLKEFAKNIETKQLININHLKRLDTEISPYKAPSAKYLDPLTFTIDRIRGLYIENGEGIVQIQPVTPKLHAEYEKMADLEIKRAVETIISEKFLVLMLGLIAEESFDSKEISKINTLNIDVNLFYEIFDTKDSSLYEELSEEIRKSLNKLTFLTDMIICVPSINYEFARYFFSKDTMGKNYRNISKEAFRVNYDMNTYYGVFDTEKFSNKSEEKSAEDLLLTFKLIGERSVENTFLSFLFVFLALSHRNPFIRCRNIPAKQIWEELKRLDCIISKNEKYHKAKDINLIINNVGQKIGNQIFNETNNLERIISSHAKNLILVSDLPTEWVQIRGVPLYLAKNMSRIPITPGDNLVSFIQRSQNEFNICSSNLRIKVINALNENDVLFEYGEKLYEILDYRLGNNVEIKYYHAKTKDQYLSILNSDPSTILIHFGHGTYNRWNSSNKDYEGKMVGGLLINSCVIDDNTVYSYDLETIGSFPPITILGACTTEVSQGPIINVANTILSNGGLSVIGTLASVNGDYTAEFIFELINKLIVELKNKESKKFETWADIIYSVRIKKYIEEPAYCMAYDYKKGKLKLKVKESKIVERFFEYCSSKNILLIDSITNRNEIYSELLRDDNELNEAFKNLLNSNSITPYSSFYTSLGLPQKIHLVKNNYDK